ncbi:MAG: radical SAM protein [Candidatus Omnitrophica bacterium]|nr:radical SAM protein [Candidatus Omnitrophota bacterium]
MFGHTNMLILKLTRDCNLRCKYCYIKNKDNFKGEMMEFYTFKRIIQRIIKDRKKATYPPKIFTLVLHGGEPLLAGHKKLRLFLGYASRKFEESGVKHRFSMQTNLTLLSTEILSVLHDYDVTVGVSFDGIKESNSSRTDINTEKFDTHFRELTDFNINFGFLMVVNKANINNIAESLDYIFKKYDTGPLKINYAEDVLGVGGSEVTGKEFFEKAWKVVLDRFLEKENTKQLEESNLSNILERYFSNIITKKNNIEYMRSNCGLKICGGGSNIIEINPDGSVHYCGRYSEDFKETYIQNIEDEEFLELKQISRYFDTVKVKHKILKENECDLCPADGICDHGCPAFYYSKYGKFGLRKDLVCEIFIPLYYYLVKNEIRLFNKLYETKKNQDGIWYLNLHLNIEDEWIDNITKKFKGYYVERDKNFKTENFNPQIAIRKK